MTMGIPVPLCVLRGNDNKSHKGGVGEMYSVILVPSMNARADAPFHAGRAAQPLDAIVSLLHGQEDSENITAIWTAYHDERSDSLGTVIPGDALLDMQAKAKKW